MFLHDWSESGLEGVIEDFGVKEADLIGINVLLASYTYRCYEGNAFVLFEKEGRLYEVNGGHCSCFGLEGQWEPDETNIEVLEHRLHQGELGRSYDGENEYGQELQLVINKLKLAQQSGGRVNA